jgi:hypothetical protein
MTVQPAQQGAPPPVVAQPVNGVPPPVVAARPSPFAGPTPVRIVNASAFRICAAYMAPQGEQGLGDDWLGGVVIEPGASHQVSVREAKFSVRLVACNGAQILNEQEVDFLGPRELVVHAGTAPQGSAPAGFRRITFAASGGR